MVEQDLLWHMEHGWRLETDPLGGDPVLRRKVAARRHLPNLMGVNVRGMVKVVRHIYLRAGKVAGSIARALNAESGN